MLTVGAEIDVLDNMVSDSKILDPTDHSTTHGLDTDVQLHHNFVDTTELSPEESALRILGIVTARNIGKVVD